jgi:cellulose synthase/poly-beta-1,6-N-acetylglucosamine synthase-like glycosyltransferase
MTAGSLQAGSPGHAVESLPAAAPALPAPVRIVVVIPAHNEAAVLAFTLPLVLAQLQRGDELWVIDDGSTDGTARVARAVGAQVARRARSAGSKGQALRWWAARAGAPVERTCGVLVLDADSRPGADCVAQLRAALQAGIVAGQALVQPVDYAGGVLRELGACSELMEQLLDDTRRAARGWPVRLRGTGMLLRGDVFAAAAQRLCTRIEDVELTLFVAAAGHGITPLHAAQMLDPKPASSSDAARQRARWLRGQARVLRVHWRVVLAVAARGPGGWSLLGSVLAKPRSVLVACKLLAALLLAGMAANAHTLASAVPAGLLLMWIVPDAIYLARGLRLPQMRGLALRLVFAPLYALWWLPIAVLAARRVGRWRSPRRAAPDTTIAPLRW